ncbi:MAG: excinuclease ABC subunit UvrC [Tannerellaceae bacterium]|jgi:excinuclease ABC subunit C|nr:excinuclease ABC subunit UvrC [Tannerellaceae bacterium]
MDSNEKERTGKEARSEKLSNILSVMPEKPGCYEYFDENEQIIYVGKAKNLKKRVASYFNKTHDNRKTEILVRQICDIKYIIVDNEEDALLLENNLIKGYRPRYNVLLKDDKTYPSIVIKNEYFPRVFQTRNIVRDGSQYFGPYPSAYTAKLMLHLIKELYPLRTCNYPLTPEAIAQGRYKVCLQYHIKRCKGPCAGLQPLEEYQRNIVQIKEILRGNISQIGRILYEEMQRLAEELRFEEAQFIKEKYEIIENYKVKSTVVTPTLTNIDVFSFTDNERSAYINYMHIGNGAIVSAYTFEYSKKLDEPKEELLALGIVEMRERFKSTAREIIVPFLPDMETAGSVVFLIPQKGEKKRLLELSEQNVKQYKVDKLKQAEKLNPEQRTTRILATMQKDLHMKTLPIHIECFDNSNTQGTNPVAACVVFRKAKPAKKDYRHFHIKTVVGPDDFASMSEVVTRRYTRLLADGEELPQLIIIDGGKGQLNVAAQALEQLGIRDKITVVGLAKRLEEIFFPDDPVPLILDKNSESLKVIQQLRDEAHRFGITFHRSLRNKKQTISELDAIKGIGEKTKIVLLQRFKSVKRIREASHEELKEAIGDAKAKLLINGLKR